MPRGFVGAAVPYAWYTLGSFGLSSELISAAPGNCTTKAPGDCDTNGITGTYEELPMDKNKNTLCYKLENIGLDKKTTKPINIMVTETCGGNCTPDNGDCPSMYGSCQYNENYRCKPAQLTPRPSDHNIQWNKKQISGAGRLLSPHTSYHTCTGKTNNRDWCSGWWSHFDLDRSKSQSFLDNLGLGLVEYTRIKCPSQ